MNRDIPATSPIHSDITISHRLHTWQQPAPKDDLQPQIRFYPPFCYSRPWHRHSWWLTPFPGHKSETTITTKPQFAGTYRQYRQSLFYSQLSCNKPGVSHDYRWISVLRWVIYVDTPPSKRYPPSSSMVLNGVNAWGCKTGLRKLDTGVWCVVGWPGVFIVI